MKPVSHALHVPKFQIAINVSIIFFYPFPLCYPLFALPIATDLMLFPL